MKPLATQTNTDNWALLRQFTEARIALGRTGASLSTSTQLQLKEAHASARDSIYVPFEKMNVEEAIRAMQTDTLQLQSLASDKKEFLLRPDLGRQLHEKSIACIQSYEQEASYDVCIQISPGLSATAVNTHVIPVANLLIPTLKNLSFTIAPVCLVENGRVAISDPIGAMFHARISIMLIGERPGLTASDSLGIYLTYNPCIGNTDAMRNCISNIRLGGLSYVNAVEELILLIENSMRLKRSGTLLKANPLLPGDQ